MPFRAPTPPGAPAGPLARPRLRPGTHVLRRGSQELQVGLHPDRDLVLTGTDAVRDGLRLLGTSAALEEYHDTAAVEVLDHHGEVLDEPDLHAALTVGGVEPSAAAAVVRAAGPRAAGVLAARRAWRLQVRGFGHPAGAGLGDDLLALCRTAGIGTAEHAGPGPDCGVAVGVGEPHRELLDEWTRAGTPYLLVRLTEGRAVIGPFVVPGSTACLRCLDATWTDVDPAWPLLVRQYANACARDRSDGAPEPVDPLLAHLALAWAARDLASYVDDTRPSTWSTTVTVHPGLSRLETRPWLRHPGCGCSWE
jgi:bacteriocin biosynthesis cyclodehydratase domain-containing protein